MSKIIEKNAEQSRNYVIKESYLCNYNYLEENFMRNILKKSIGIVCALALTCGMFSVVSYAATKTGSYSKLVGTNDQGNSRAIATAKNTTASSKYLQVFLYKGNGSLITYTEGSTAAGATKQVNSSNSYSSIIAKSCIYNAGSPNSGALEGLTVTVK